MKQDSIGAGGIAVALVIGGLLANPTAFAADESKIVHDAEYYILEAQHGEKWAMEDKGLDQKLADLHKKFGTPLNIIYVLWDDTPVGEVGIPFIQKQRGWETPNINRLATEGINFTRMYSEPSCTQTRAAAMTGRLPIRNGMFKVGFPYEYGGLSVSEVTIAEVLSMAGYATGFFGKWHLGDIEASYPTNQGFDETLWMPYNQTASAFTPQGQASMLSPAVLIPQMYPNDPYDMDKGWRPMGFVNALEGTKGGPIREVGVGGNLEDYQKLEPEFDKRTLAFIQKNAAAKKPFFVAWWPALGSLLPSPKKLTANGAALAELLTPFDVRIGNLMSELKKLGIAENTLVVIMADNGPFVHNGPPGFIDTLYRGGKGDFLEGGVRVPAMALMRARHELWMAKYPNTPEARGWPLQGIENARPATKVASQPRMNAKDLPFDPLDVINQVKGWGGSEFDQSD